MAGGTIAALVAKIGADTTEYQVKMGMVGKTADQTAAQVAGASKRMASTTSANSLIMANAARGGAMAFSSAAVSMTASMAGVAGASPMVGTAIAGLTTGFSNLSIATTKAAMSAGGLAKLSPDIAAGMGLAVVGVASASYAIGRLASELGGLDDGFNRALSSSVQLTSALAGNEEQFRTAYSAYENLRKSLKATGPEWDVSSIRTEENARKLSTLTETLLAQARAQRGARLETQQAAEAQRAAGRSAADAMIKHAEYTKALRAQYDVMTRTDVEKAMSKLAADVASLAKDGVPWQQIMEKVAPKFAELQDEASAFTDLNVPKAFTSIADAMRDKTGFELDQLLKKLGNLAPVVKSQAEEVRNTITHMADGVEITIPVKLDLADAARQIAALKRGEVPPGDMRV